MSETTCSCTEHPWRLVLSDMIVGDDPHDVTRVIGERGMFWVRKHGNGHDGPVRECYCDRCGTICTSLGTAEPQVPKAQLVQAERREADVKAQLDSCRPDANLFSMVRALVAFGKGCFLLKDGDRIVVGEPTEGICYAKIGEGCDEREAVWVAYENMMRVPPCDREMVTL